MSSRVSRQNEYLSIIAGGKGTRLFPISTPERPKPFCPLPNGKSFIQETVSRFCAAGMRSSNVVVAVTNDCQRELAKEQLLPMGVLSQNIIIMPDYYGYAGAMVKTTEFIHGLDPDAVVVNTPADQFIKDSVQFKSAINTGIESAKRSGPTIIGVKVNDLDTFVGCGHASYNFSERGKVHHVTGFIEKPDRELANTLMRSGNTACNTGINIWKSKDLLDLIRISDLEEAHTELKTNELMGLFREIYLHVGEFDWHDCGTLKAYYDICDNKTPNHRNVSLGGEIHRISCRNSLLITIPRVKLYVMGARNCAIIVGVYNNRLLISGSRLTDSQSARMMAEHYEFNRDILNYRFAWGCNNFKVVNTNVFDDLAVNVCGIDHFEVQVSKDMNDEYSVVIDARDIGDGIAV